MVKKTPVKPEEVAAAAAKSQNESNAAVLANFDWATNAVKLNRSIAFVQEHNPDLKGADREAAVKARYVALNGLLADVEVARASKSGGKVVNTADNDGSKD